MPGRHPAEGPGLVRAPAATRRRDALEITSATLAFCAARWHIVAARYRDLVAFPPPSLGVSSLDLGRLHPRAAPFLCAAMTIGQVALSTQGRRPVQCRSLGGG